MFTTAGSAAQILPIANGQFQLPASFSPVTNLRVITAHPKGCAWLLTETRWAYLREKLDAATEEPLGKPALAVLKRIIVGHGSPLDAAADGCTRIPQTLLDFCGITDQVVWMPTENGVQLWSPEKLARRAIRPTLSRHPSFRLIRGESPR